MKISIPLVCSLMVSTSSAFTSPNTRVKQVFTTFHMESEESSSMAEVTDSVTTSTPKPKLPQMSESLPFLVRPAALDGTMVGDVGFDPLGFAKSKRDLLYYREAEIKHARLAMLVRCCCW
jgi:hypothetical protein